MLHKFKENTSRHNTRFMICALVAILVLRTIFDYYDLGWKFAAALSIGLTIIYASYAIFMKEFLFQKVLVFAIVAGFTELIADRWLVDVTTTLVYFPDEPFIVRSPFYMPFSWAMVLTSIGYTSHLISKFEDKWKTIVLTVLMGSIIIPLFEYWAYGSNWWWYRNCEMIYHVPYYIIIGEALLCASLAGFIHFFENKSYFWVCLFGVVQGLWIWGSYYIGTRFFPYSIGI